MGSWRYSIRPAVRGREQGIKIVLSRSEGQTSEVKCPGRKAEYDLLDDASGRLHGRVCGRRRHELQTNEPGEGGSMAHSEDIVPAEAGSFPRLRRDTWEKEVMFIGTTILRRVDTNGTVYGARKYHLVNDLRRTKCRRKELVG